VSSKPVSISDADKRYRIERPRYVELLPILKGAAEEACKDAGIKCAVTSRVKETNSFLKKLIRSPQAYEKVFDKAGVRIVPVYPDDRMKIVDVVRGRFDVSWERDFDADAKPDSFTYRAYHLTIQLRSSEYGSLLPEVSSLCAELQVHTPGAHVWANLNHGLVYKTWLENEPTTIRAVNRLSAMLELVDITMGDLRKQIISGPSAHTALVLEAIEKDHLRLNPRPFDEELTRMIVTGLSPLFANDVSEFIRDYGDFVTRNEVKLRYVFAEYSDDYRHILVSQPEALLLFYWVESAMVPEVEENWPEVLARDALDAITSLWSPQEPAT
jgi:ppGpp synthetase/RelA/SpoT-type nucleotidyltranferase